MNLDKWAKFAGSQRQVSMSGEEMWELVCTARLAIATYQLVLTKEIGWEARWWIEGALESTIKWVGPQLVVVQTRGEKGSDQVLT